MLLPPGIHVWTSESLEFHMQLARGTPRPGAAPRPSTRARRLNDHIIYAGPYTLITVNEGYAAVDVRVVAGVDAFPRVRESR